MARRSLQCREVNFVVLHDHSLFLREVEIKSLHGLFLILESNIIILMKLQYCVYVLLSLKDKKFYIGYTTNLKQRLTDHFHG